MEIRADPILTSLFGSRNRLMTLAVLANSDEPLTGYRVAKVAHLPRQKVYPEIRRGIKAGLIRRSGAGYSLADPDVRALLRKRVRIRWDEEWDRARSGRRWEVNDDLAQIRLALKGVKIFDSHHRIPDSALRELERDPEKNRILRKYGGRASGRKE
jgi:hypothetical protein